MIINLCIIIRYELHSGVLLSWRFLPILPRELANGKPTALAVTPQGRLGHVHLGYPGIHSVQEENIRGSLARGYGEKTVVLAELIPDWWSVSFMNTAWRIHTPSDDKKRDSYGVRMSMLMQSSIRVYYRGKSASYCLVRKQIQCT